MQIQKQIMNRNQQNMVRDGEVDGRRGRGLARPPRRRDPVRPAAGPAAVPRAAARPAEAPPVAVRPEPAAAAAARVASRTSAADADHRHRPLLPELGETNASASKRVQDQIAVQIVSMMEKQW